MSQYGCEYVSESSAGHPVVDLNATTRGIQSSSSVLDLVAQPVEHGTFNAEVAGSNPAGVTMGIAKTMSSAGH